MNNIIKKSLKSGFWMFCVWVVIYILLTIHELYVGTPGDAFAVLIGGIIIAFIMGCLTLPVGLIIFSVIEAFTIKDDKENNK